MNLLNTRPHTTPIYDHVCVSSGTCKDLFFAFIIHRFLSRRQPFLCCLLTPTPVNTFIIHPSIPLLPHFHFSRGATVKKNNHSSTHSHPHFKLAVHLLQMHVFGLWDKATQPLWLFFLAFMACKSRPDFHLRSAGPFGFTAYAHPKDVQHVRWLFCHRLG